VPSALYSFSFEPNSQWTRILPPHDELWSYLNSVATKYDLKERMSFGFNVERCEWIEESARWRMTVRHIKTDTVLLHECQFLFCATGQLVNPREIDVPGSETFKGPIFHTSRWRSHVDLRDKKVVVFGNGCTAAQVVPSIVKETKHLTQFVRAKHWIMPPIDAQVPPWVLTLLKWLPGLMRLQRLIVFIVAEYSLLGFPMTEAGRRFRAQQRAKAEKYMRSAAPAKYHDLLIPDFEVGCKRRIFDSGYLKSLHEENLTLTDAKPLEIVPDGVRTAKGLVEADVIVLANGFITNDFLIGIDVRGQGGKTLQEHWSAFGGAEAYNCSVLSGFPNMFILLGPNAATGHTSAVMAAENSVNYALRVIKPVLDGRASIASLKWEAEEDYSDRMQEALRNTVWNSGCQSWYVRNKDGGEGKMWNAMSYPWSQAHFWYRSLFPVWSDWEYRVSERPERQPLFFMWDRPPCVR
jgi:cation diffusion facilitator CzcD-associated flavoprotein CzcO